MLPAGLGIVCASQKALAKYDQAKLPRCFFDFGDMRKANATGYFPYTPSLPMLYGLRESLAMLLEEGLENVFARHHRLAEGTRAAVKAWGLELCARAPKWHSDTVSAIMVPARRQRRRDHRHRVPPLQPGARRRPRPDGRAALPHRPPRRPQRADAARRRSPGAEMAMRDVGMKITPGSGVAAAQEYWRSTAPAAGQARAAAARAGRAARRGGALEGEGHRRRRPMSHTRYEPARPRLQRSELAVPGSQPAMFPKALESEADVVFLDLEDAVAPADKEQARTQRRSQASSSTTGGGAARRSASASTASTPTTCTATWWTWWSRPATGWTRCSSRRSACRPTSTWWTPSSPRSRRRRASRTGSGSTS